MPRAYGEKVTGEIKLAAKLSQDEAKDESHKLVTDDEGSAITGACEGRVEREVL